MLITLITILLAVPLILYIPGLLISRLAQLTGDLIERYYERVLISVLLNGWLALLLAELGIFSIWLHLALLLLLCGALILLIRRTDLSILSSPSPLMTERLPLLQTLTFIAVGIIALLLVIRPFETIIGSRDAGVYSNTGFAIARTGSLVQYDALLQEIGEAAESPDLAIREPAEHVMSNFLGVQNRERFIATRLHTAGFFIHEGDAARGRIVPQHLHLTSAWIGLLTSVAGFAAGLFAPGLMGLLGAWSVGMLGRRLANHWVGLFAFLLLALNSVQVWFARSSTSETTAQFLTFAGLYGFAKWQASRDDMTPRTLTYAALVGVALGQLALNRIDAALVILPVVLYLLYCAVSRRWQPGHTILALALTAMVVHAALHIVFIARAYFFDTAFARLQDYAITSYLAQPFITPILREVYHTTNRSPFKDPTRLWREVATLGFALGVLLALWRWQVPLQWVEAQIQRWSHWIITAVVVAIVVLATYAYLIRPQIMSPAMLAALPSCLLPQQWNSPGPCLTLQGYIGAPIALPPPPSGLDEKYMIPLANFVRLGWYLSPLGITLGVIGFALWWKRGLHRASWLFLVVGFLGTFIYIRDTYGTSDQSYIYILRRFIPIAYPAFSLGMAYALVALTQIPAVHQRRFYRIGGRVAAALLTLALLAFFVGTGLPIYRHVEYDGAVTQLAEVAKRFGPRDIVLFRGGGPTYQLSRDVPDLVVTPLQFGFGLNTFAVKSSQPSSYADVLAAQVRQWKQQGYTVYLALSASGGNFALPGFSLQPAGNFALDLPEFEQLTNQKPHNVGRLRLPFTFYRLTEGTPGQLATLPAPLTPSDVAAQVRGFYLAEESALASSYVWTDGDALLRISWQDGQQPHTITLTVGGGERPPQLDPARLCLSLWPEIVPWSDGVATAFTPLGCLNVRNEMATYQLALDPQHFPSSPLGSALLRFESDGWIPAEVDPRQLDRRRVGVQFARLALSP